MVYHTLHLFLTRFPFSSSFPICTHPPPKKALQNHPPVILTLLSLYFSTTLFLPHSSSISVQLPSLHFHPPTQSLCMCVCIYMCVCVCLSLPSSFTLFLFMQSHSLALPLASVRGPVYILRIPTSREGKGKEHHNTMDEIHKQKVPSTFTSYPHLPSHQVDNTRIKRHDEKGGFI